MSLINDALRKARQEAAQRDAEDRGHGYRPPRAHLPSESKMGLGVALGVAVGFVAAFAGAALFFSIPSSPPQSPETASPPAASSTAADGVVETPAESAATSQPIAPAPTPTSPPAAREPAPPIGRTAAAPAHTEPAQPPPSSPPPPAPQQSSSLPADPPAVERPANTGAAPQVAAGDGGRPATLEPPQTVGQVGATNVFVLEADLGDVRLVLDFIVWAPDRPFAQINGQQVEMGQIIEGLLVEKIERDRVTLQASDGRLVLRVR